MPSLPNMRALSHFRSHRRPLDTAGWDLATLVQVAPLATLQYTEAEDPVLQTVWIMRLDEIPQSGVTAGSTAQQRRQLYCGNSQREQEFVCKSPIQYGTHFPTLTCYDYMRL